MHPPHHPRGEGRTGGGPADDRHTPRRVAQGFDKHSLLTLGAAGNLLQAEGLEHSNDVLFENVAGLLFDQTVSYANFESPVTEQELKQEVISDKESPTECCSREQFDILKGHKGKRFTVLHTANNHMFDMGSRASIPR